MHTRMLQARAGAAKGKAMTDFIDRQRSQVSGPLGAVPAPKGVGGWLLALCLMLTLIGPMLSMVLLAEEFAALAPYLADDRVLQAATLAKIAVTACAVAFGVYAGLRLWAIRPQAVSTAKQALLFGLAADILAALLQVIFGPVSTEEAGWLREATLSLVPGLLFFTLSFAYLNSSARVQATYGS